MVSEGTYLFVVLEAVLVLVSLLAANDGATERFDLFRERYLGNVRASHQLLLT